MKQNDPHHDERSLAELRALDALLEEVHGKVTPPDLSDDILAQLGSFVEPADVPSAIVCQPSKGNLAERPGARRRETMIALSVIVAMAASLLLVVVLRRTEDAVNLDNQIATNEVEPRPADQEGLRDFAIDRVESGDGEDASDQPPRGIPLVVGTTSDPAPVASDVVKFAPQTPSANVASTLVAANVGSDMEKYWQAIGVEPSAEAAADEISQRLKSQLGVELPAESLTSPDLIQQQLQNPETARAIAHRWLNDLTQGGLRRIDPSAREGLIDRIAASIQSTTSLDRLLANLAGGDDEATSAFYEAFSAGGEHQRVRRLAQLTMNVDLRCMQCHDSFIEGNGSQQDYWSFAAFFRDALQRKQDRWVRRPADAPAGPVYYALPDGRQKLAEPMVPGEWLSQRQPITTLGQWSGALVGSEQLARGIVNSLWRLVHDQPLSSRAFDVVTAPHHDALDRLEQRLTDDLVASQFDIGRTLALIIASPAARRAVPESLLPENAFAASDEQLQAAHAQVGAFAAAAPPRNRLSLNGRIDIAMQRIGRNLDSLDSPVLAQGAGSAGDRPAQSLPRLVEKGGDFPSKASGLPAQWLSMIDSKQEQVEHLAYLAGMSNPPATLWETAMDLQRADEDWQLTLQRVWWLVRPQ